MTKYAPSSLGPRPGLWSFFKSNKLWLAVGLGLAAVFLLILIVAGSRQARILFLHDSPNNQIQNSTDTRYESLHKNFDTALAAPFGRGPGTSGPVSLYTNKPMVPDDYFLQVINEFGFVGLCLFLAVSVAVILSLWPHRSDLFGAVLLASFVGLSISNLFLHNWADDTIALYWWGIFGWYKGICYKEAK